MSKEKRTRKITVRFTPTEFEGLEKKFKSTVSTQISYYIRNVLLGKPVVVRYRNESLDSFMEEIIFLRQELHAIGNNFNQAVRRLHALRQIPEFRIWIQTNEDLHQRFFEKTTQIDQRIEKISGQWLQG